MEGKTHMLTGIAAASTLYSVINKTPLIDVGNINHLHNLPMINYVVLGAAIVGAVAPDLDIPESFASSKMTFLNLKIVKSILSIAMVILIGFIAVNANNRVILYCGGLLIGLMAVSYLNMANTVLRYLRLAIQYGIVIFLVYMYIRTKQTPYLYIGISLLLYIISRHRGISHTPALNFLAAYTVYYTVDYYGYRQYALLIAIYFLLGAMSHIYLNDIFTNRGVPNPIYPFSAIFKFIIEIFRQGKVSLSSIKECFKHSRIKFIWTFNTGSAIEEVICVLLVLWILLSWGAFKIFS